MIRRLSITALAVAAGVLLMGQPAHAQSPDREITVWGISSLDKQPTVLRLELTMLALAPTAEEAAAHAESRAEELIVEFRQFGLQPNDWRHDRALVRKPLPDEPKRLAFWATVTLSVRLNDFTAATAMLDRAHALKAAGIRMRFELDDPAVAYESVLERAIDDARRRAQVIARELNVTLGPPLGCEELSEPPSVDHWGFTSSGHDSSSAAHQRSMIPDPSELTTIDPQPIGVHARVRVRFAIVR